MRSGERHLPRLENYTHTYIHPHPPPPTHTHRSLLSLAKKGRGRFGGGQVGAAGPEKGERRERAGEGVQPPGCEEVSGGVRGGGSRKSFPPAP